MIKLIVAMMMLLPLADLRPNWDALVEAERAFGRNSIANGTRAAFLGALADDSVIFRPRAVPGKKWTEDSPAAPSQLSWEPEFADIAASGDLGYTTGPWEIRRTAQDPPGGFGHYVTLWRKQANGEWKAELDNGISHEQAPKPSTVQSPVIPKEVTPALDDAKATTARTRLVSADKNASTSLLIHFAESVRLYRDGSIPFVGKAEARKKLAETPGTLTTTHADAKISGAGDLGYSYGMAEFKPQDSSKPVEYSNYLRIWKLQRDGTWKIVLDMLSPAPKP